MGSRRDHRILEAKIWNIQYLLPVILSIFKLVTPWHKQNFTFHLEECNFLCRRKTHTETELVSE